MANIQIGKYKRPGIFVEEYDKSIIASPTFEGITNLVIGCSKKGPFNVPIRLTNTGDLDTIYGSLDRGLERKGSFFHRTIAKMLEIAPVYAFNLLLTDDDLDRVEYQSLSSSSGYFNDIKRDGPYRRFFDTTGFWKRDTETFINLTKPNQGYEERAFSLTNLSDKPITVFAYKSQRTGFDRTLLEWYGSKEKMPPYVNAKDYAADYLVDVVVVGGDWSNYKELSVDPRWSQYFSPNGIRKDQVSNFANDRNITLLAYYEALSLIPYFRDLNGNNIFIETAINRDTDSTGLFCAFNNELVEEDFYNGVIDLIGNTHVDKEDRSIEFLSYKELISEDVHFEQKVLDLPGNSFALLNSYSYSNGYDGQADHSYDDNGEPKTEGIIGNSNRTAWFGEDSIKNIKSEYKGNGVIEVTVDQDAFVVINKKKINIDQGVKTFTINYNDYPTAYPTVDKFTAVVLVNDNGEIEFVENYIKNDWINNTESEGTKNPVINNSDLPLGFINFELAGSTMSNDSYQDVYVDGSGYNDLVSGTDYVITPDSTNPLEIKIEFTDTKGTIKNKDYNRYRKMKFFNRLVSTLNGPNKNLMTMLLGPDSTDKKYSAKNIEVVEVETRANKDKFIKIKFTADTPDLTKVIDGFLCFYYVDDEVILGENGGSTIDDQADLGGIGVISKHSKLYSLYYDGIINTGDFFYINRLLMDDGGDSAGANGVYEWGNTIDIEIWNGEDLHEDGETSDYSGYDYIIFKDPSFDAIGLQVGEQILIPNSKNGVLTINVNEVNAKNPKELANDLYGFVSGDSEFDKYRAYPVLQDVENEKLKNIDTIYNYNQRRYLRLYVEDNNHNISLKFKDQNFDTDSTIISETLQVIQIQSDRSNLKQSLEIEGILAPNEILVDGGRYTEIKVGDFLEAYYDENELEFGEVPRKLTRILKKRRYDQDHSLVVISTDSEIKITKFGTEDDMQTMRYVQIDDYAKTLQALTFKGFKIRRNSLPDGTEERQNDILNLVAKGTPLFKALTNKEAFDFRYLIDSFGLGLTERSKQQLMDIVGDRLDAFAFLNMPSLRSFKNSSSPTFVDGEGVLQTKFIAQGGDPESGPAFLYSFGEGKGTTAAGYFTPYVTVNDHGRPVDVPPAAWVANTYMRKHVSNITSTTPWTISAGVTNGRVTNIVGLEMDFTLEDIENLNMAQMNPIVYKRNRGNIIETENTAQVLYKSALSYIHVREVLIELERELSRMLLDYQWKYNTPDVRAEIKLRADVICETYVSKNGLYNYFNKMDDENNTPEIIDNQIGVLDTFVEPIKGMGIIVNNITILRTGAIDAGGFMND